MPDNSASAAALRADGHWLRAYLSVYVGAEVATFTLDSVPTYPAFNVDVTLTGGAASNIKNGFRVEVYDSTGLLHKGTTRIRYDGLINAFHLPLREFSAGWIDLATGDVIKVYKDVRLSDKLVTATADFNPDNLEYNDEGSNPPPLANSGGAWAGWDWMLPIPMTGSTSIWVDPDSNGPLSHLWTYPTGLTGSSTTAADPNITAATAGEYLLTHRVTDDDSTKSTTQYVSIIVHTAASPPYDVVFEAPEWNEESGGSVRVRVFDRATRALIPDGAFVVLWSEPNASAIGLKSSGRSHIIMTGTIRREEADFDAESGVESLTFEIISPMARLDELVGYSKVMLNDAAPNVWSEIKTLMTMRGITQIIQFYCNLIEAGFDLAFAANYRSEIYPALFLQEQTPVGQVRELADGTSARFVCLRDGSFEVHMRPELVAIGDRSGEVVTLTLTSADLIAWQYTRQHWRPVKLLEVRGFSPGNSPQPIFSRWPGLAPGVGNEGLTVERIIADGSSSAQIWLNEEAGRRGAAADGIYVDADGVFQYALDLELTLPASYWGVFEFYSEYIAITLTTALRSLDFSDQLFVLRSKSFDYDAESGTGTVRLTLRTATNGAAGQTYVPPQKEDNGLPPVTPPDFNFPPFDPFPIVPIDIGFLGRGIPTLFGVNSDGYGYYFANWSNPPASGGPLVTRVALGLSSTPVQFLSDPFSLGYIGGGAAIKGKVNCLAHLHSITAIETGTPTIADTETWNASEGSRDLQTSRSIPNLWYAVVYYKAHGTYPGTWYSKATDSTTWQAETQITALYNTDARFPNAGLQVSEHLASVITTSAFTTTGSEGAAEASIYRSTDGSAATPTFSAYATPATYDPMDWGAGAIHIPFHDNASDSIVYFGGFDWAGGLDGIFFKRRNADGTVSAITPTYGGKNYGPEHGNRSIASCPINRQYVAICGYSLETDMTGVWLSKDGGDTWNNIVVPLADASAYLYCDFAGNDPETLYLWGSAGRIAVTHNAGDAAPLIEDKRGNIITDFLSIGTFVGICGLPE